VRRLVPRPDFGSRGKSTWLRANFFEVKLPSTPIFLYEVSFDPAITINRIKKSVHERLRQHPTIAAFEKQVATDGSQYLVSTKQLNPQAAATKEGRDKDSLSVEVTEDKTYKVKIERRAEISPSDMKDYLDGKASQYDPGQMTQALNILLAKFPRDQRNIVPVGANRFFLVQNGNQELAWDIGHGLCARKGFYSSIRPTIGRMLLNVNVCTKVFYQTGSLLSLIAKSVDRKEGEAIPPHQMAALRTFLYGLRVTTTYTKQPQTRTIQGLGSRPQDEKFTLDDTTTGTRTLKTVAAYFKERMQPLGLYVFMIRQHTDVWDVTVGYNVTLKYPNLPTIILIGPKNQPMHVPAELLKVTEDQTCKDDKISPTQIGMLMNFACKQPGENARMITQTGLGALGLVDGRGNLVSVLSTHQICNELMHVQNHFDMKVRNEMVIIPARILGNPIVKYRNNTKIEKPGPSWNLTRMQFINSGAQVVQKENRGQKADWAYFIIEDSGRKLPLKDHPNLLSKFQGVCKKSGLNIQPCTTAASQTVSFDFTRLDREPKEMDKARSIIEQKLRILASKVKIVLVILDLVRLEKQNNGRMKPKQMKGYGPVYSAVKYAADVKCGVPTVCCQWDKLCQEMGQDQYMANVAMKFNFKLGGINHQISDENLGILKGGKAMLVSIITNNLLPNALG
jgi:eukaryotic translation initiation factor 2C